MTNIVKLSSKQCVLVKEVAPNAIKVQTPGTPVIVKVITAGPQGASALSNAYTYTQSTPALNWTINHSLGYRPSVEIIDDGSREIDGDVYHPTINQTVIIFNVPVAGSARLI
jgi:hypothetical protein